MKLVDRTLTDLLAAFRSSDPTPGGGSASALAGAVGASLLAMVSGIPKPRASSADDLERLQAAGRRCAEVSRTLEGLVDRDSEAYELVVGAYRMPKTTDGEKTERSSSIQRSLRAAIEAPLDVMRACGAGIEEAAIVARFCNRNASSDVQVALELLTAGLRGAKLNVEINLDSIKDRDYVDRVSQDAERMLNEGTTGVAGAREQLLET